MADLAPTINPAAMAALTHGMETTQTLRMEALHTMADKEALEAALAVMDKVIAAALLATWLRTEVFLAVAEGALIQVLADTEQTDASLFR